MKPNWVSGSKEENKFNSTSKSTKRDMQNSWVSYVWHFRIRLLLILKLDSLAGLLNISSIKIGFGIII